MKPFDQLTLRGKARRLRKLALRALEQYDLPVASVHLLGMFTNAMFRVRTAARQSYVLRICTPGWRTETDILSEVMWLQDLACQPEIGAPRPIVARNGEFLVRADALGLIPCTCVLMTWLPGVPLEKHLTEANLFKMGMLFARMHTASLEFTPPPGFTERKMDQVLARGEENVLFQETTLAALPNHQRGILEQVNSRVENAYCDLYAGPGLRVIHHDLWHGNIHIHRGKLYPLDFEDTVWGYPAQDIAMALQDLMDDVAPEVFEPLQAAFRGGYTSLLSWPETSPGQIDTFRVGRMLWVCNYIARFQQQHFLEHMARVTVLFQNYLNTGLLRKVGPASSAG